MCAPMRNDNRIFEHGAVTLASDCRLSKSGEDFLPAFVSNILALPLSIISVVDFVDHIR